VALGRGASCVGRGLGVLGAAVGRGCFGSGTRVGSGVMPVGGTNAVGVNVGNVAVVGVGEGRAFNFASNSLASAVVTLPSPFTSTNGASGTVLGGVALLGVCHC